MKVLITGVAGMIGSHIAEALLKRGDHVYGIDNYETGKDYHVPEGIMMSNEDICFHGQIDRICREFEPSVIVHCAASYKNPDDWVRDSKTNVVGTAEVVRAAKKHNCRLIYFQTSLCYGQNTPETRIPVDYPINPTPCSYAITKTAGEQLIKMSGVDYVSFRLANVIGPRNVAGPLPVFYQRLKAGKKCFVTQSFRDFVYVKDLVKLVVLAIDGTGAGVYHFSSGTQVSIMDLYVELLSAQGMFYNDYVPDVRPIGDDDVATLLLDNSRTVAHFGPINKTPLKEIVRAAVEYYSKYGVEKGYTHLKIEE